jgi:ribose transport system ATP-binding protein
MAAVMGATRAAQGSMDLEGRPYRPRSPLDALEAGISLVPESRKEQGLILDHSVLANFELTALDRFGKGPFVADRAARKRAAGLVERLDIKLSNLNQPVSSLSGGNQQKVVIAKALATDPRVLLLDEPTRGIDIGAKSEIHHFIRELVDEGMAVVMVTSVLPELLQASDRIMVMKAGRTVAELEARSATEEEVTRHAFQG